MPRRSLLTPAERAELFALPADEADLIRYYTLSALDLSVIQRRRGDHNRLGFTVLLCCLRHPGFIWGSLRKRKKSYAKPIEAVLAA